ncbi:MAG TPA: tetratricopeptide repeat protein [Verrucomicrobiae bacterium]|nr:tetratricopeptide repeat protein [Verrucomicrobiae bacterium]
MLYKWVLAAMCVLIVAGYAYLARLGGAEWSTLDPADAYYNLLVQGYRAGHLSLNKPVPADFAKLADPYDPIANQPYRILPYNLSDLSYYKGGFYLYFGPTPAVLLYWPLTMLTEHYVFDRQAVTIFCSVGFLASIGLLRGLWRRYFAKVSGAVLLASALALGLAAGIPTLLPQSETYQVAISCGYMLTMLALGALWRAMHSSRHRALWLGTASLVYGLAVGARPSLVFGGVILLAPVIHLWRQRQRRWALLLAAVGPITVVGLALLLYNFLRFENAFEFGWHYQLGGMRQVSLQLFSPLYFWFNLQVYALKFARWHAPFPFVHAVDYPPMPSGYFAALDPFGILANIPLVWLALAAPLAWQIDRGRQLPLRSFVIAVAVLFGMCALTLAFCCCSAMRYEVDFLPALMLLAVVGIFGLEHALAGQPLLRRVARWCWGVVLAVSVMFNLLVAAADWATAGCALGTVLADGGRASEGVAVLQRALSVKPDYADGQQELGHALLASGQPQEAIEHSEAALRLRPDDILARNDLALALAEVGRLPEAIEHWEQSLRIEPDDVNTHINLGNALLQVGRLQNAIAHYEQAVRIDPDSAVAQYNLGNALQQAGKLPGAISHYEQALRIKPDFSQARDALAAAQSGH